MTVRRSRPRAACSWIYAAVAGVSLGFAGAATAAPGSDVVVSVTANVQDRQDGPTQPITGGQTQHGAPGQANDLQILLQSPAPAFMTSVQHAQYRGPGDVFGRVALETSQSNSILVDRLHTGSAGLSGISAITSSDLVTVSGLPSDNRLVTFHTVLSFFFGDQDPDGAQIFYTTFSDSADFSVQGRTELRVVSSGIGPSDLGNDVFSFTTFNANQDHQGKSVFGLPTFINFDLTFNLGQATAFDIQMIETMDLLIQDRRGTLDARLEFLDGARLSWSGSSFITDAVTGETLCGLTIASAAGVDYGSIPACPVTGGGGGAGGVPEPAAWALMIAGFGLAGARLRGRRSSSPAAQA